MKEFVLGSSKEDILRIIPERRVKKVRIGNQEIGIIRIAENFYGFQLFCPHRGASLLNAFTNSREELICPLHEYRFDLKTGQVTSGSCGNLKTFPCQLTDQGLLIQLD